MQTCYMCEREATTKQHVPPSCFFPRGKDLGNGCDYRRKLTTVPSCERHNLSQSKDDEYLRLVVVSYFGNNDLARKHWSSNVFRGVVRRPWLGRLLTDDHLPARVGSSDTGACVVDMDRFNRSMEAIVKGLYFHGYEEKWIHRVLIVSPSLLSIDGPSPPQANAAIQEHEIQMVQAFDGVTRRGDNPEVFYYQIGRTNDPKRLFARLVFYEGFVVNAFSSLSDNLPPEPHGAD
jgi:hypothetical protein